MPPTTNVHKYTKQGNKVQIDFKLENLVHESCLLIGVHFLASQLYSFLTCPLVFLSYPSQLSLSTITATKQSHLTKP